MKAETYSWCGQNIHCFSDCYNYPFYLSEDEIRRTQGKFLVCRPALAHLHGRNLFLSFRHLALFFL
jgi:hypothetical protein